MSASSDIVKKLSEIIDTAFEYLERNCSSWLSELSLTTQNMKLHAVPLKNINKSCFAFFCLHCEIVFCSSSNFCKTSLFQWTSHVCPLTVCKGSAISCSYFLSNYVNTKKVKCVNLMYLLMLSKSSITCPSLSLRVYRITRTRPSRRQQVTWSSLEAPRGLTQGSHSWTEPLPRPGCSET